MRGSNMGQMRSRAGDAGNVRVVSLGSTRTWSSVTERTKRHSFGKAQGGKDFKDSHGPSGRR